MYKDKREKMIGIRFSEEERELIEAVVNYKRSTLSFVLRNIILDTVEKEYLIMQNEIKNKQKFKELI